MRLVAAGWERRWWDRERRWLARGGGGTVRGGGGAKERGGWLGSMARQGEAVEGPEMEVAGWGRWLATDDGVLVGGSNGARVI